MLVVFSVLLLSAVTADGLRNPSENDAAVAQGNALAAQSDASIHCNPPGMTHLRGRFLVGIEFLSVHANRPGAPSNLTA